MYVCIYVNMYMYIHMYLCMFVYVCMYVYVCVCMYVCIYVCMYVCRYMCVYVCMCVCVCVCVVYVCFDLKPTARTDLRGHIHWKRLTLELPSNISSIFLCGKNRKVRKIIQTKYELL